MSRQQKRYRDLIEAGRRVMAEKGYEDAKVSDIVRQAGVAQGTFYLYFPTKLDLVIALAREMQQEILSRVQVEINHKDVLEDLMTSVTAALRVMESYKDIIPIFSAISAIDETRWKAEQYLRSDYYVFVQNIIEKGQKDGIFRSELNPEIVSRFIVGMIEYVAHECFVYHSGLDPENYIQLLWQLLKRGLLR